VSGIRLLLFALATAPAVHAQTVFTWTGSTSQAYLTGSNWSSGSAPSNSSSGTDLLLAGTSARNFIQLPAGTSTVHAIFVSSPLVDYNVSSATFGAGTLAIGNGGVTTSGSTSRNFGFGFGLSIQLLAAQTWNTGIDVSAYGDVSGAFALTKTGTGKLTLGGNNTFSGGLIVGGGTLVAASNSAAGTGTLTFASSTTLVPLNSSVTLANPITIGNNVTLGLASTANPKISLTLGGTITSTGNITVNIPTDSLTTFGGELTGPARTTYTFAGGGQAVLAGSTGNNVDGYIANGTAIIFASKSTLPGVSIQATNGGYIGIGKGYDGTSGNLTPGSLINKIINQSTFNGTLGFDTDPNDSSPAVFNQAINTSGFTGANFTGIGSLSRATLSGTITPPTGGDFKFGGGTGTLYVSSALTGSTGLTVASSTLSAKEDERLTVFLQGANTFTGDIKVTASTLIFDGATALPTGAGFNLGDDAYVGYTERATNITSFAVFLDKVVNSSLVDASLSRRNADAVIGIDSQDIASPRTVFETIDLSLLSSAFFLGTATKVTLSGTIKPPSTGKLVLTGVNGGYLKITSPLLNSNGITNTASANGVTIGNTENEIADVSYRGVVELMNSTSDYASRTSLASGYLLLGSSSTLVGSTLTSGPIGKGSLVLPTGADQPALAASVAHVVLHNNLTLTTPGLQIGVPTTTDSTNSAFPLQNLRGNNLTLNGVISGTGDLDYYGVGSTLTLAGANTFAGNVTVNGGTLRIGANNTLPAATQLSLASGATLDVANNQTIAGFFGADGTGASIVLGSTKTLTVAMPVANTTTTFAGNVSGAGIFAVSGAGGDVVNLTGNVTNTGGTLVGTGASLNIANGGSVSGPITTNGVLSVGNSGSQTFTAVIGGTGSVATTAGNTTLSAPNTYTGGTAISGGKIIVSNTTGSATGTGTVVVSNGGTIGGTGFISGPLVLSSGGIVSPGNSPGTLSVGPTTFTGGASFTFDINNTTGTAGTNWDLLSISGSLTVAATGVSPFVINLVSLDSGNNAGLLQNFNSTQSYAWPFVTTTTGITGFSAGVFQYNASQFQNSLGTGFFFVSQNANNLVLNFTPVPEPSTWALLLTGLALAAFMFWRRRS